MEMFGEAKIQMTWLTRGVVIASIPAVAYLLAYLHEIGYALYFHIPFSLISISSVQFCVALISVVSIWITGFFLFHSVFKVFYSIAFKYKRIKPFVLRWSFLFAIGLLLFILTDDPYKLILPVFIFLIIFVMIMDYFVAPKLMKLNEKVNERNNDLNELLANNSPGAILSRFLGIKLEYVVYALIILFLLTVEIGYSTASGQTEFLVQEGIKPLVVLRVYNDNMIIATFDRNSRQVDTVFFIRKIGEDSSKIYAQENIGPLTSAESKSKN